MNSIAGSVLTLIVSPHVIFQQRSLYHHPRLRVSEMGAYRAAVAFCAMRSVRDGMLCSGVEGGQPLSRAQLPVRSLQSLSMFRAVALSRPGIARTVMCESVRNCLLRFRVPRSACENLLTCMLLRPEEVAPLTKGELLQQGDFHMVQSPKPVRGFLDLRRKVRRGRDNEEPTLA